jgi:CubicO group peptidase (beta-lactamase class C family)
MMRKLLLLILLVCADPSLSAQPTDALPGLWSSESILGAPLGGELRVVRKGPNWTATLADARTTFAVSGSEVRFAFGNRGQFRGRIEGRSIAGFWLQPEGVTAAASNASGASQAFASPLVLKRDANGGWRGMVHPLEERFTLYLRIFPNTDGTLLAAFRNPEQGSHGGAMQFKVTRDGDVVVFSAGETPLIAKLVNDRLQMFWPDMNRVVELTRRTPSEAAGFFPHPAGEAKYVYQKPPSIGDGWPTERARDVGMDETMLTALIQRLIDSDPSIRRAALMHSILVAHEGKLVLEEYFFGFDRNHPHDLRSAGKTFSSVMLGAAMREGVRIAPETPIYLLLASKGPFANPDPRKAQITLANLMTHTSGLACDDNDAQSPGNEGTMQMQKQQPDWWKYTLDLPMAHDPGSRYAYCSANINLVGAALTTATGTWLPELFERTVARPLQFGPHYWNLMPTGEGYLGGGAYLLPRDFLKVGQAYLDGGVWHGHRIVDASWITTSTAPHMHISPATTGIDPKEFGNSYGEGDDGYAWHLSDLKSGDRTYHAYAASGNGGQLLVVVPDADLAVVFTAGNYGQGGIWGKFRDQIVPKDIIAAIKQ